MRKSPDTVAHKAILVKLHKATFLLDRITDSTLQKGMGLHFSHFLILMALGRRLAISQRDIAKFHGVTEAAVSRQLELLRKQGLIHRRVDPVNRRKHLIVLSKRGELQLDRALTILQKTFERVFSVWTPKDQQRFIANLQTLLMHICDGGFLPNCRSATQQRKK